MSKERFADLSVENEPGWFKEGGVNAVDKHNYTRLHWAAMSGNLEAAKISITTKGIVIDPVDEKGFTPLHRAAIDDKADVARLLIESGANVNAVDCLGRTPLSWAAGRICTEVLRVLAIAKGVEPNTQDLYGNTALHTAVYFSNIVGTELLLAANGIDVNVQNDCGDTPLHRAAYYGYIDIVKMLIAAKVKLNIENYDNQTPLDLAELNGREEALVLLKKAIEDEKKRNEVLQAITYTIDAAFVLSSSAVPAHSATLSIDTSEVHLPQRLENKGVDSNSR